jgi:hypothetical protein
MRFTGLTSGAYRHCFDPHGYLSTEERSGDFVHGRDSGSDAGSVSTISRLFGNAKLAA